MSLRVPVKETLNIETESESKILRSDKQCDQIGRFIGLWKDETQCL